MEDYSIHQIQCVFFILPYYCIHATAYCIHDITISHTHIQHPVSTIYTNITICTTTTHPHTYIHILHYILYCYRCYYTTHTYYTATIHFPTVLQVYTFTQYLHTQTHKCKPSHYLYFYLLHFHCNMRKLHIALPIHYLCLTFNSYYLHTALLLPTALLLQCAYKL